MINVSVIIPVHNVPIVYLKECFASLSAQAMEECEFIIVLDGSPEQVWFVCEAFSQKDRRFRLFRRTHAGVSASRNFGLQQAQGTYIAFVDADDVVDSSYLSEMYTKAVLWKSEIIATNHNVIINGQKKDFQAKWNNKNVPIISSLLKEQILEDFILLKENSIPRGPWGKLFLRNFLTEHNLFFNTKLEIGEDLVFNLNAFSKAKTISFLNKKFYFYRKNNESATRRFRQDFFQTIQKTAIEIINIYGGKFNPFLWRFVLGYFYQSWENCYMHPKNPADYRTRMKQITAIIKSNFFQYICSISNYTEMPIINKIELFLFKRKITFFIWFHGAKAELINHRKKTHC